MSALPDDEPEIRSVQGHKSLEIFIPGPLRVVFSIQIPWGKDAVGLLWRSHASQWSQYDSVFKLKSAQFERLEEGGIRKLLEAGWRDSGRHDRDLGLGQGGVVD